ncbi:hypothetical protein [Lutispora saccharofermentans]|uniref:Uncharacterized protein n=1 Tax=Lutispora saccharofermentans TaxID=3024236 RepID=A0ABT1NHW5_9FIRM|nr:hypothetical protein [Lutispora saccharofermentans]MCQ1530837.1 hypothetical protein [Lutispora saccharofermentans]
MENYAKLILEHTQIPQNVVYEVYEVLIDKESNNIPLNYIEEHIDSFVK